MSSDSTPDSGTPPPRLLIIALGSNLGDSSELFQWAIERIQEKLDCSEVLVSDFIRSEPLDCPPGSPEFLNAVIAVRWHPGTTIAEAAESLLVFLQSLEKEAGRGEKKILNEPRPLDLDIIDVEGYQHSSKRLVIPHPRAMERSFVTGPLAQILPGYGIGHGFRDA